VSNKPDRRLVHLHTEIYVEFGILNGAGDLVERRTIRQDVTALQPRQFGEAYACIMAKRQEIWQEMADQKVADNLAAMNGGRNEG
jgi:hypothetical protein